MVLPTLKGLVKDNRRLGSHCVARAKSVVASGVGGFAKANILIYVGLGCAPLHPTYV
ncbi:hypothetical protein [Nostoc sp. NMS2]|uniref:hypothetical protein n=1 Tax=Nostoc sp. NMS2 TaxID=2815389 RepID=UPI0025ED254F|nr:hypothetical protein [Nostoc sp. NMS2]